MRVWDVGFQIMIFVVLFCEFLVIIIVLIMFILFFVVQINGIMDGWMIDGCIWDEWKKVFIYYKSESNFLYGFWQLMYVLFGFCGYVC